MSLVAPHEPRWEAGSRAVTFGFLDALVADRDVPADDLRALVELLVRCKLRPAFLAELCLLRRWKPERERTIMDLELKVARLRQELDIIRKTEGEQRTRAHLAEASLRQITESVPHT